MATGGSKGQNSHINQIQHDLRIREQSYQLYPKPAAQRVSLRLIGQTTEQREATLELLDLSGQIVHRITGLLPGQAPSQIDLPKLNTGLYLLRITDQSGVWHDKLMIRQ